MRLAGQPGCRARRRGRPRIPCSGGIGAGNCRCHRQSSEHRARPLRPRRRPEPPWLRRPRRQSRCRCCHRPPRRPRSRHPPLSRSRRPPSDKVAAVPAVAAAGGEGLPVLCPKPALRISIGQVGRAGAGWSAPALGQARPALALWAKYMNDRRWRRVPTRSSWLAGPPEHPSSAAAAARTLIQDDKAIAPRRRVQPDQRQRDPVGDQGTGVPVVGGDGAAHAWTSDPYLYDVGSADRDTVLPRVQARGAGRPREGRDLLLRRGLRVARTPASRHCRATARSAPRPRADRSSTRRRCR